MAASTTKKATVRRFEKEALFGYVNLLSYLQPAGMELLLPDGQFVVLPYQEVKAMALVRDFTRPGELERRVFNTRPKMEGLWVNLQFRDGDAMEGILPNDLLQLERYGFTVIPPDPYSNQQRVFIPRAALRAVEVLGVIGSPLKKRKGSAAKGQIGLFDDPREPE